MASVKNNPLAGKDIKKLSLLSFLHFANDVHSGVLPTIIPMLARSISLTLSQAGVLNSLFGMIHLVGQPLLGFVADRQKKPYNAVIGPVLCAAGACLLPLAPNFTVALLMVALLGVGTALFHPQGWGLCGRSAGSVNLAFFISVFAACGTLGSAIGPVYIVYVVSTLSKKGLPFMVLPIALVCVYVYTHFGTDDLRGDSAQPAKRMEFRDFAADVKSIMSRVGGIVAIATLRDATNLGIRLFLPTLIVMRGGTNKEGGLMVFAVTMASAVAGVVGGRLADAVGYTRIAIGALSFSPFFLFAGLTLDGPLSVVLLLLGFALLLASNSVTTAMAQSRCPEARSTVSSLAMGVSWGLANLFTSPVGYLADRIGLLQAMRLVCLVPWTITAWYLFRRFRNPEKQQ